jgi:GWxTD domain-containing protein
MPSQTVNVLMTEIDISSLPSGNYNLVVEVRNRNNDVLASREMFFQRSKIMQLSESGTTDFRALDVSNTFASKMTSKDTMAENIRSLWPISSALENTFAMNQMEMADLKLMQQYFYDFWQRRNHENPAMAWNDYKTQVDLVNEKFSSGRKKGYMTERGRVFLQYGAPNQITQNYNEPTSYPYEIWQYYKLKNQSNRKFVFYNPNLGTNDFTLLHSDATGEIYEQQWEVVLKKRTESMHDFDQTTPSSGFGSHSGTDFSNPH